MQRYIAIAWSPEIHASNHDAVRISETLLRSGGGDWHCQMSVPGLALYSRNSVDPAMRTYVLPGQLGAIVGRLFSRHTPETRQMRPEDLPGEEIVGTQGLMLLERFWGKYIAFLKTKSGKDCSVVRDCSGQIPCFYLRLDSVYLFFSDIRDIDCIRPRLTINERYLAAFISRQPLHVRETGLNEITELLAGDIVTVTRSGLTHRRFWNPRKIAMDRPIASYAHARAHLVGVTESVICSWAQLYQRILLHLSGGLDSAIVLGCLKRLGLADRVLGVTEYTAESSGDERHYARAAATMANIPLIELPRVDDGETFANNLPLIPPDPRPDVSKTNRILHLERLNAVARDYGCDTVWTGQGGDQLFLQAHHPYAAADYVMGCHLPLQLPSIAYHSALLSRQSVWAVLRQAAAYWWRPSRSPPLVVGGRGDAFLADSAPEFVPEPLIWRLGNEPLPPGKVDQLDILLDLLNRHKPIAGLELPYEQHPLISQPLIELSLRIPTYHLLRGGRQRAMARDAFADRVPACIIKREDKGMIPDQLRTLLRSGSPYIRETLLDGVLVTMGILNRSALVGILNQEETFTQDQLFPLFACIAAETWARHWTPKSQQAAAA